MVKERLFAVLLVILLYIFPIYAQQTDYNDYTALEVEFDLSSEFSLYPTSTNYELAYVSANLTFYPQTLDNQRVISLKTRSSPQISVMNDKDSIIYMWDKPPVYQFSYGVNSRIYLINTIAKIEEKVSMPNIDNEYTKASGLTETAKVLSKIFFGDDNHLIRFDMSSYQSKEDIPQLIGSLDKQIPGLLTEKIRELPYGVLLLDEIEKAHYCRDLQRRFY